VVDAGLYTDCTRYDQGATFRRLHRQMMVSPTGDEDLWTTVVKALVLRAA
jgi:hypothetical protein